MAAWSQLAPAQAFVQNMCSNNFMTDISDAVLPPLTLPSAFSHPHAPSTASSRRAERHALCVANSKLAKRRFIAEQRASRRNLPAPPLTHRSAVFFRGLPAIDFPEPPPLVPLSRQCPFRAPSLNGVNWNFCNVCYFSSDSYPVAVREWASRAMLHAPRNRGVQTQLEGVLRAIILQAYAVGDLWSRAWATYPLPARDHCLRPPMAVPTSPCTLPAHAAAAAASTAAASAAASFATTAVAASAAAANSHAAHRLLAKDSSSAMRRTSDLCLPALPPPAADHAARPDAAAADIAARAVPARPPPQASAVLASAFAAASVASAAAAKPRAAHRLLAKDSSSAMQRTSDLCLPALPAPADHAARPDAAASAIAVLAVPVRPLPQAAAVPTPTVAAASAALASAIAAASAASTAAANFHAAHRLLAKDSSSAMQRTSDLCLPALPASAAPPTHPSAARLGAAADDAAAAARAAAAAATSDARMPTPSRSPTTTATVAAAVTAASAASAAAANFHATHRLLAKDSSSAKRTSDLCLLTMTAPQAARLAAARAAASAALTLRPIPAPHRFAAAVLPRRSADASAVADQCLPVSQLRRSARIAARVAKTCKMSGPGSGRGGAQGSERVSG